MSSYLWYKVLALVNVLEAEPVVADELHVVLVGDAPFPVVPEAEVGGTQYTLKTGKGLD